MKRLIQSSEDIFCMSKLVEKRADKSIVGEIGKFVYFSENNGRHGPRIKFYGGSAETDTTRTAPSYTFSRSGAGHLILQQWMDKQNCPNAFDSEYIQNMKNFINNQLSILLLVWYRKLDESDALAYFEGRDSFETLLQEIQVEENLRNQILNLDSTESLHQFCLENNLYED